MMVVTGLQVPPITVVYTNYKGETSTRKISPLNLFYGANKWHLEPQWLMEAWDHDKKETRTFALKDMRPA